MRIGYFIAERSLDCDQILKRVAERLLDEGYSLCGVTQDNIKVPQGSQCEMVVNVLPDGPNIKITQMLGSGSKGCKLDVSALESAVQLTNQKLTSEPDAMIVNKFGKHEIEGHGFRPLIGDCLSLGVPILLKVNQTYHRQFTNFAGDFCEEIAPDSDLLTNWVKSKMSESALVS